MYVHSEGPANQQVMIGIGIISATSPISRLLVTHVHTCNNTLGSGPCLGLSFVGQQPPSSVFKCPVYHVLLPCHLMPGRGSNTDGLVISREDFWHGSIMYACTHIHTGEDCLRFLRPGGSRLLSRWVPQARLSHDISGTSCGLMTLPRGASSRFEFISTRSLQLVHLLLGSGSRFLRFALPDTRYRLNSVCLPPPHPPPSPLPSPLSPSTRSAHHCCLTLRRLAGTSGVSTVSRLSTKLPRARTSWTHSWIPVTTARWWFHNARAMARSIRKRLSLSGHACGFSSCMTVLNQVSIIENPFAMPSPAENFGSSSSVLTGPVSPYTSCLLVG